MIRIDIHNQAYRLVMPALDIGIPLNFQGPQPSSYGLPPATSRAYRDGQWVGDVREGGSCNFAEIRFTPHCNGTHTESVGHLSDTLFSIHEVLQDNFIPATVITISPQLPSQTTDSYDPAPAATDALITRALLEKALDGIGQEMIQALVIRTLPNPLDKRQWGYQDHLPPYFSLEAMTYIHEIGVTHLLVDLPSVDRLHDEGKLRNHRIFWQLPQEGHAVSADNPYAMERTITEFIFVPPSVADGHYVLDLQIAAFVSDAAPSRPRLYALEMLS